MISVPVPPSRLVIKTILSLVLIASLTVSFLASSIGGASADTFVFEGSYTSTLHVEETANVQVTGLDLTGIANGSAFIYNMTIPTSSTGSVYSEDGFSQSITGLSLAMTTSPAGVPYTQSDLTDGFGNSYREYVFNLTGFGGTTLDITATASFFASITADATSVNYTDPIGSSYYPQSIAQFMVPTPVIQSNDPAITNEKNKLLAGATTEAEAVDRIMDFVKTQITIDAAQTAPGTTAVSSLNSNTGTCVNRAYLALALLRSAGIPARYITGMAYGNQITLPLSDGGYSKTSWNSVPDALHAWVDVYYPDEQVWVPYDPYLEKGFVDTRHIISGISIDGDYNNPATHGDFNLAYSENVNPGISVSIGNSISVSGLSDSNGFQYIYTEPQPSGQDVTMYARALQYVPFNVPTATPVSSNNTTVTPKPATTSAVTTLVPGPDTSKYNLSGTVVDSVTGAPISGAIISLGAVQITSNAQGKFVYLYALTPGSYTLTARDTGYVPQNQAIVAGDSDMNITVKLTPAPDANGAAAQPTPKPSSPAAGIILAGVALAGAALLVSRRKEP